MSGVWVFEAEEKDADSESAKEYRPQRNPRKGRKGTEIQICQLEIAFGHLVENAACTQRLHEITDDLPGGQT